MGQHGPNKQAALEANLKAIAGVDKVFTGIATVMLDGTTLTPAQLKAIFQAEIDTRKLADQGHAAYTGQLADAHAARVKASDMRKALRAYVLATFGAQAKALLEELGMKMPRARSTSAVKKAQAVQTASDTRKARHTLGKKQKQAIKGTQAPAMPVKQTP